MPLFANVGVVQDLTTAKENGAEGVGLYRTEFPFLVRGQFPTRDEQERIYARAYEVFPAAPIHFRVLDLGGDKFIAHDEVQASRDPFHGYRGLRVLFDHPHVLIEQVQAFAAAAGARPVSILLPMVTSLDELRRAKAIVLGACPVPRSAPLSIGVMVEVPGAVEIARHLAAEVDFVSIGTNDLVQYALVRDREDPRMSSPTDGYHPAVLAMVARTIAAVHAAGRPVQVCGEIAARPDLAALLVAMGVDGLSLAPRSIPEVKRALASARIAPIRDALGSLLACGDAAEVQARLREVSTRRPTAGRT